MRRSRPISIRWSRLPNLEAFAKQHGLQMIYRKQYESPRYPEMRRRKPAVRRPGRCRRQGDELLPARQDRRAARRLPRDPAKALNHERDVVRGKGESRPPAGDASARRSAFGCATATPMVSFTFDDLPKSAVTTGAEMLEAHGARGTFYVSGGLVGVRRAGLGGGRCRRRARRCTAAATRSAATPSRISAPATSTRPRWPRKSRATAITSARSIRRYGSTAFAYPFGYGSFARKQQLKDRIPDLPQHRAGRQRRQRRPAVPARHAADRSRRWIATGSTARSTRRKPITDG